MLTSGSTSVSVSEDTELSSVSPSSMVVTLLVLISMEEWSRLSSAQLKGRDEVQSNKEPTIIGLRGVFEYLRPASTRVDPDATTAFVKSSFLISRLSKNISFCFE